MIVRQMVEDVGGLARNSRAGDNPMSSLLLTSVAADANDTVTIAKMAAGIIQYTGFSAGRNLTVDTAANILAAIPNLDIGDSFMFLVSIVPAFAGTWVTAAGVTLAGRATTPASSSTWVLVTKTSATTVTITVM